MSNPNGVVRHFHPAWYASVMGTGGLANALHLALGRVPFFETVADVLVGINIALFLLFLLPWIGRWIWHFDRLSEDLKHPMLGNFFVTMPVGALILGANFFLIGPDMFSQEFISIAGIVLYVFAVVLIFLFTVLVMYNAYVREDIQPDAINFAWFITPVADIVIPVLGGPLVAQYIVSSPGLAGAINMIDMVFFGIGFMLFIFIGAVVFNRLVNHKLPHAQMAPTFWILLGPIGMGGVGIFAIANSSQALGLIADPNPLRVMGTLLWGFGFWAFIQTIVLTIKYWKAGIPFSMTWWAFIFPFAAYIISTFQVAGFLKSPVVFVYGMIMLALLFVMWLVVLVRSIVSLESLLLPAKKKT